MEPELTAERAAAITNEARANPEIQSVVADILKRVKAAAGNGERFLPDPFRDSNLKINQYRRNAAIAHLKGIGFSYTPGVSCDMTGYFVAESFSW